MAIRPHYINKWLLNYIKMFQKLEEDNLFILKKKKI